MLQKEVRLRQKNVEDTEARQEFTDPRSGVSNGIVRGLGDWRRGEKPQSIVRM